jgi:hypothetical protein
MRQACRQKQIKVEEGALDYAVGKLFAHPGLQPRGSFARDILDIMIESASFDEKEPIFDRESFDHAYQLFMTHEVGSGEADESA